MNNKILALIAVIAVSTIVITAAVASQDAFAKCKKSRSVGGGNNQQTIAQANVCGNGSGASDVNCQNLASQIQGDGNAVNVIGVQ